MLDTTAELLGVDSGQAVGKLVADLPANGDGRAQVIMLALVLGALESRTPKDAWWCRFPSNVADGESSTCGVAGFSSKWQTWFSHLRGESYNHTVVQISIVMRAGPLKRRRGDVGNEWLVSVNVRAEAVRTVTLLSDKVIVQQRFTDGW